MSRGLLLRVALGLVLLGALVAGLQAWVAAGSAGDGARTLRGEGASKVSPGRMSNQGAPVGPGRADPDSQSAGGTARATDGGLAEGCQGCHAGVSGFEASHEPARIGCASCHRGVPDAQDAAAAHAGLVRIPGNAADVAATCGAVGCHLEMPLRLERNIMSTLSGVVSVDRYVFGEQPSPTGEVPIAALGTSPADLHLRNLCASCHLGNPKREAGPITERSRGGGCNACHLQYPAEARADLERRRRDGADGGAGAALRVHPQLRTRPTALHCFGCHSRSGRVSLNYEGWREVDGPVAPDGGRVLEDGRVLGRREADVHAERGLVCVDCHGGWEVMGEGASVRHREDQQEVRCDDCHLASSSRTVAFARADPSAQRVVRLTGGETSAEREFLVVAKTGRALASTLWRADSGFLERPGQRPLPLRPQARACGQDPSHRALACAACHDAWAPQCIGCHTAWKPDGEMFDLLANEVRGGQWQETLSGRRAEPPSLGVRETPADGGVVRRVEEFTPGMVLTLDRGSAPDGGASAPLFRRLFAPSFPHTIQRTPRSCVSCHANPLALGFGRGRLDYVVQGRAGTWRFTPELGRSSFDGLPEDAWTGFLVEPSGRHSTRDTTRPFSLAEQRRVLTVGACLTCHLPASKVMREGLADFASVAARRTPRCVSPRWP